MTRRQKRASVEQHPSSWRAAFQGSTMRLNFALTLTQPMLEELCAIADGVQSDRELYFQGMGGVRPHNWIATWGALEKRGLIRDAPGRGRKHTEMTREEREELTAKWDRGECTNVELTPAGSALVELLKVTGIFVAADAALIKKARDGKRGRP